MNTAYRLAGVLADCYAYGSISRTLRASAGVSIADLPRCRFRFGDFFVRMCRIRECRRLTLPLAVNLNRFRAPRCVFSFIRMSNYFSFRGAKIQMRLFLSILG